jgi:tRNA(Ile)-lysidine synthase
MQAKSDPLKMAEELGYKTEGERLGRGDLDSMSCAADTVDIDIDADVNVGAALIVDAVQVSDLWRDTNLVPFEKDEHLCKFGLAVGLSGGPDSMALLWLLSQWGGAPIHALIVDHNMRPNSADEARLVATRVAEWPNVTPVILTRPKAEATKLMEAAREDRYALMADYCASHNIRHLALGHHRDDVVETFLFRLAKGSGLDGLAGILPVASYNAELTILRPLLAHPKNALIATCDTQRVSYVVDPTNSNLSFSRNRLRAAMDVLEAEGLTAQRLSHTAQRIGRAREALDFYADEFSQKHLLEKDENSITFDYEAFAKQPLETQRRVLQNAIQNLKGGRSYAPRMLSLEEVVFQLSTNRLFKAMTCGGCVISRNHKARSISVIKENISVK